MAQRMIKILCMGTIAFFGNALMAQTDTTEPVQKMIYDPPKTDNWGIGMRIVNGQGTAVVAKQKLEFYIQHRFGYLNQGKSGFYGFDESNIRLGFDYGVTKRITLGVSRANLGKMFNGYFKWNFVTQNQENPVSVTWYSDMAISAAHKDPTLVPFFATHRFKYTHQLLISKVFGPQRFMLQLAPTLVHRNLVDSLSEPNDMALIQAAGRLRLTKKISLTGEYNFIFNHQLRTHLRACIGGGIEFYTAGHVFQIVLTNAMAMTESQFLTMDNGKIEKGQLRVGFNIVRRF